MSLDVAPLLAAASDLADRVCAPHMNGLRGSSILAIAQQVRAMQAEGREVYNLTIGDFDSSIFPIPTALRDGIKQALDAGHTNYPPAVGTPELRAGIRELYERELGLKYPEGSVIVGSGARPPIYSAFRALIEPGDTVVYPVPSWNVNHYCYLNQAKGIQLVTQAENGFMPTVDQLLPHLGEARMIVINSPQNPSGSVIEAEGLRQVCEAIVAENNRRRGTGDRPLFLMYDQVYWQLTFGTATHHTPVGLVPEMAPYTILVDAISKCWAGTGLRVGWAVCPPVIRQRMGTVTGHMGAWAPKETQMAVAELLSDPTRLGDFMGHFKRQLQGRLERLQRGIEDMQRDGLPIHTMDATGAIYLSVKLDLLGKTTPAGVTLDTDEAVRSYILEEAGVAFVPFTAFGYPEGSGWIRLSVGSVSMADVEGTLTALRKALTPMC